MYVYYNKAFNERHRFDILYFLFIPYSIETWRWWGSMWLWAWRIWPFASKWHQKHFVDSIPFHSIQIVVKMWPIESLRSVSHSFIQSITHSLIHSFIGQRATNGWTDEQTIEWTRMDQVERVTINNKNTHSYIHSRTDKLHSNKLCEAQHSRIQC